MRSFAQIRDHRVGAAAAQVLAVSGRVDPDHQREPVGPRRLDTVSGCRDDGTAARPQPEPVRGLDQRGGIGAMDLAEPTPASCNCIHERRVGRSVTEVEQHRVVAARVDADRQLAFPAFRHAACGAVSQGSQTDLLANNKTESWLSISKRATAVAMPLASSSTSAAAS